MAMRKIFKFVSDMLDDPPPTHPPGGPGGVTAPPFCGDTVCHNPEHLADWSPQELEVYFMLCSGKQCAWIVPFAGNAFVTTSGGGTPPNNLIAACGLANWHCLNTFASVFVHSVQSGPISVGLRLRLSQGFQSHLRISVTSCTRDMCQAPQSCEIHVEGGNGSYQVISCGTFHVPQPGYLRIDIHGLQRTGPVFADISHAILIPEGGGPSRHPRSIGFVIPEETPPNSSPPEKSSLKFVADSDDFYFGRRGPSVHLQFTIPKEPDGSSPNIEYFYNEVHVPQGKDVIGAYFCAIGFSGGYFGIQVNSATERRILFSIWSDYNTDNPRDIPEDFKVVLLQKGGGNMHVGEFGNEGSGGQSYLRYPWKADTTYKFLVQAKPLDDNNTMFSAWFCDPSQDPDMWNLVASFRKPKVSTFLHGLYSFSENFIPEMGHIERHCHFGNQWGRTSQGRWIEVTQARFTADATAAKEARKDVAGGVVEMGGGCNSFFLRNCGFFSDAIEPNTDFCRRASGFPPNINFLG